MFTRLTKIVVVGVFALVASPLLGQSKVDQTVAKALGQIEKATASKDTAAGPKLMDEALGAAAKLEKEGTPEALLGASRIQAHAGKLEQAAATAKRAIDASASAPPELRGAILAQSAGLDLLRGTSKDAAEKARQGAELAANANTLSVLALAQANAHDSQAVETAEKAVKADASSAASHDALGHALAVAGKHEEAIAELDKALQLDPKLYRALIHKSMLYLEDGKAAEAEAAARAAVQMAPQHGIGVALLGRALFAKNPKDPEALNQVVQASFLMEDHSAFVKFTEGKIFEGQGRYNEASARYQKAVEIDPSYTPARVSLLQLKIRSGDWAAAEAEAKKIADENPANAEAQLTYGLILLRKNDYAGAQDPLERATELMPNNHEALANLGTAYFYTNDPAAAVARYKRAVELAPDNLDYRIRYGLYLGMTKQTAEGVAELKKVVQSGYKGPDPYINLGFVYLSAEPKKPVDASIAYKKALEIDPKNASAALGLGRAQLFAKQYGDAADSLQKAATLDPKIACEATLTIAWVYVQMAIDTKSPDLSKAKAHVDKAAQCLPAGDPRPAKFRAAIAQAEKGVAAPPKDIDVDEKPKGPDLPSVVAELRSGNPEARRGAARKMVIFGEDAVQYLLPMLNSDNDLGVRTAVAKALGTIGAPAAKACTYLMQEFSASGERMVLPIPSGGKKPTAEEEAARFDREKQVQAACKEARAKIGCH
jgi:tetratricopeptide (TPR) repeat protein